jgi:hypothetical protein
MLFGHQGTRRIYFGSHIVRLPPDARVRVLMKDPCNPLEQCWPVDATLTECDAAVIANLPMEIAIDVKHISRKLAIFHCAHNGGGHRCSFAFQTIFLLTKHDFLHLIHLQVFISSADFFSLSPISKSELFPTVVKAGMVPRKTFSMGHAVEKRYYFECRKIL